MVVSLPYMEGMPDLAERLVDLEQGSYEELVVRTGERLVFPLREDARGPTGATITGATQGSHHPRGRQSGSGHHL